MLFPPSTNDVYRGTASAAVFLGLLALLTIGPALIHLLLPDGGAGVIAGLDLSKDGPAIIRLFAWAGATQLVWGLMLLAIAVRYRHLVPLALVLLLIERCIHAVNMWWPKSGAINGETSAHHPPEAYATLVMILLLAVFATLALRRR